MPPAANGSTAAPPSPTVRLHAWIERFVEDHEFVESEDGPAGAVTWSFDKTDRRLIVDLIDGMLGEEEFWRLAQLVVEHFAAARVAKERSP